MNAFEFIKKYTDSAPHGGRIGQHKSEFIILISVYSVCSVGKTLLKPNF